MESVYFAKLGGVNPQCISPQHYKIAFPSSCDIDIVQSPPWSGPCLIGGDFPSGSVQRNEVDLTRRLYGGKIPAQNLGQKCHGDVAATTESYRVPRYLRSHPARGS